MFLKYNPPQWSILQTSKDMVKIGLRQFDFWSTWYMNFKMEESSNVRAPSQWALRMTHGNRKCIRSLWIGSYWKYILDWRHFIVKTTSMKGNTGKTLYTVYVAQSVNVFAWSTISLQLLVQQIFCFIICGDRNVKKTPSLSTLVSNTAYLLLLFYLENIFTYS